MYTCHTGSCSSVKTAVAALSQISEFGGNSGCAFSRQTGFSYSTVRKVLRDIMHYFLYKIHHSQKLLDRNKSEGLSFAVNFLNRMTVICHGLWIFCGTETLFSTSMTQSIHAIAAFGLRKIRRYSLKFLYILQKWLLVWIHDDIHPWSILFWWNNCTRSYHMFCYGSLVTWHAAIACCAAKTGPYIDLFWYRIVHPHISMSRWRRYCSKTTQTNVLLVVSFVIHSHKVRRI